MARQIRQLFGLSSKRDHQSANSIFGQQVVGGKLWNAFIRICMVIVIHRWWIFKNSDHILMDLSFIVGLTVVRLSWWTITTGFAKI